MDLFSGYAYGAGGICSSQNDGHGEGLGDGVGADGVMAKRERADVVEPLKYGDR